MKQLLRLIRLVMRRNVAVLPLAVLFTGAGIFFVLAQGLTGTIFPNGDVTRGWPLRTGCDADKLYMCINEDPHSTANYVNTGTGGTTGETLEFEMSSVAASNVEITQFSVTVYAHSAACLGNANPVNCDTLTINIRKGGNTIGTSTVTMTTSNAAYTVNSTGGPWTSDSDLQVQVIRNRIGGGNSANADDDVRLTGLRATVTYTQNVQVKQVGYRWFENMAAPLGGTDIAKISSPTTAPSGSGTGASWSPSGQYLTVATGTYPYITIYKRDGDTLTKLSDPAALPPDIAYGTTWSPDGQYMSVLHANSPYITIYKRSGDTFAKLTNPTALPTGTGYSASWSPDGQYLSVAHLTSPFVTIYEQSGDTFTKLANPSSLPASTGRGTSWSPDGQYLSVAHSTTPFVTIYKRSGDTFAKLANPSTLPTGTGYSASWSPDGQYLSVAHSTSPFVTIYKRSGDTFTKLSNPGTLPAGTAYGASWAPDGRYLSVAHESSPALTIYQRSGDTFTKLANPSVLPAGNGNSVSWSPSSQYLAVAHTSGSFVSVYKRSIAAEVGEPLTAANTPATAPSPGVPFRLRLSLGVSDGDLTSGSYALQYAYSATGSCTSELSYVALNLYSVIRWYDNQNIPDGLAMSPNANDPARSGVPVVRQAYNDNTTFSVQSSILDGQDGMWDIALTLSELAPTTGAYCVRAVPSGSGVLSGYDQIATILLPSTSMKQSSYRWYQNTDGVTPGSPLAAQNTAVTAEEGDKVRLRQAIRVDGRDADVSRQFRLQYAKKTSTCSAATPYVNVMPSTGGSYTASEWDGFYDDESNPDMFWSVFGVGTLVASSYASSMFTPYRTSQARLTGSQFAMPSGVTIAGIEVSLEYTTSEFGSDPYIELQLLKDGLPIGSTRDFPIAPSSWTSGDLTVGSPVDMWGASLTAADLAEGRLGLGVAIRADSEDEELIWPDAQINNIVINVYKSADAEGPFNFYTNATPVDGASIGSHANDPTDDTRILVPQNYRHSDPFTFTDATSAGRSALWDMSLQVIDDGDPGTYCFRVVNASGAPLDDYLQYPELTISAGSGGGGGPTLNQRLRGGQAVIDGVKTPLGWQ